MKQIKLNDLKGVLDVLEKVFEELRVDFYMIGAIAKEYWYQRGNKRMRQTKDVDFAVLVTSKEDYDSVRDRLKDHHFASTRGNAFVMISPQGIQVDLLPFGEIAIDDGLQIIGEGMTSIRVNGFLEVYQSGTAAATIETGHLFKAATLPAIVLLKLIAFDDRPEVRQKDARDIAGIFQHFFDLQSELIFGQHNDLFAEGQPDRSNEELAALVIGREIKKICGENHSLKRRIVSILATIIANGHTGTFIQQMVGETRRPVDEMKRWLEAANIGVAG